MYVLALTERLAQSLVAAQMGHYPQLYLTVVGREQYIVTIGHKSLAYMTALLVADGYVLQIGIGRAETSGGGDSLIVGGVNTARSRIYQLGQSLHVCGEQLFHASVFEYQPHYLMTRL